MVGAMYAIPVSKQVVAAVVATCTFALSWAFSVGFAPPANAAAITVTTTDDEVSANGQTSLREAITQSNGTVNVADTITLQAGVTYVLDLCDANALAEEDLNTSGDLDHTDNNPSGGLTIEGNGATIEQTCEGERILEMRFAQPFTLRDVTMTGGDADLAGTNNAHGGAVRGSGAWLIEDSTFTDNEADGIGAAMENGGSNAVVTIRRSQIVDNGPGLHGAVRMTAPGLVVEDSVVSGNTSAGLYGLQGATIEGSIVHDNGGGGYLGHAGGVTVSDSTISSNGTPGGSHGAISVTDGPVNVTNTTITDNDAATGAGISASGAATFDLDFVTFTGNESHAVLATNAGSASLHGVVLGAPASGPSCNVDTLTSVGSFDQGTSCGLTGNNVSGGGDPVLGALAGAAGAPQTRTPGFGSPVVDLVPEGLCSKAVDQRGAARPIDGDFDGEDECDAGAVERAQGQPFTDVGSSHPFFTEIGWMGWNAISTGSQPGPVYKPSDPVSRQAMSAFLYRLAGAPPYSPPPMPTFVDVSGGNPFFDEIEWMNAEQITTGFPGSLFKPVAPVTRQSMSAFMHRMANEPAGPFPNPGFSDVSASHPFFLQISWMADAGISNGYDDDTFKPSAAVTRQAMSAFMFRFADVLPT
jgi:CSLREA domain-containing protein